MSHAVLFPGQGSQHVGMGSDLFDRHPDLLGPPADEVLGWSLRSMCLEGPEEDLTATDRAQPALYATSYALWLELEERGFPAPAAGAGHSLGEYTALAAAGAVDYFDGLRLVAERGRAMSAAATEEPSGMAALLGGDLGSAEDLCTARRAQGGRLWTANINAPGQVVVAGGKDDIAWAAEHAREFGIRRIIPLKVAGAFHSPYMVGASERLRVALAKTVFSSPRFPVIANATALPHGDDIAQALADQLTSPVRFAESLGWMAAQGIDRFVHCGPGDVTAGLATRSVEGAEAMAAFDVESVRVVVSSHTGT